MSWRWNRGGSRHPAVTQQSKCLVTSATLPPQLERRKIDIALPDLCRGISAMMENSPAAKVIKAYQNSPLAKLIKACDDAIAPIRAGLDALRQFARSCREACWYERRAQHLHHRAGLKRAPRRRTATASVRRATADSGGSSDGDPPPRPRARGPPPSRVGRAASGTPGFPESHLRGPVGGRGPHSYCRTWPRPVRRPLSASTRTLAPRRGPGQPGFCPKEHTMRGAQLLVCPQMARLHWWRLITQH